LLSAVPVGARIACTVTCTTAGSFIPRVGLGNGANTTGEVVLSRPMLTNGDIAQVGRYQRTGLSPQTGDYDAVGFPIGLRYDGQDDGMYTAAPIDYSGTDKTSVIYAAQKAADVAAILVEHGPTTGTTPGTFYLSMPESSNLGNASYLSRGSAASSPSSTTGIPVGALITFGGQTDINAPSRQLWKDGVQVSNTAPTMGSGNFSSQISYEGARGDAAARFNGMVYGEFQWGDVAALSADRLAFVQSQFARLLLEQ